MKKGKFEGGLIKDNYTRRIALKNRIICLIKKAMQLSYVSVCEISFQVFWKEDGSLVEYMSDPEHHNSRMDSDVQEYA
jgi:hypothetical protein